MQRIVCSAPGRANLIGNPSDQYGGCTLACSVPLRARVVITPAEKGLLRTAGVEARVEGPADLELRGDLHDVARAVLQDLGLTRPGCLIEYGSEIPRQSGLGGSSALVVALLRGLVAFRQERGGNERDPGRHGEPDPGHRLAEWARSIERRRLGVACGYVDQYLGVFGGLRFVDFRGKTPEGGDGEPWATVESLSLDAPLPFVLAFTGVRHSSGAVHTPIRERWLAGEPEVVAAYERVAEIGRLGKQALLLGDWPSLGALMNENHAIQRDLGGSGESNERLIRAALGAGALGAKLAGAGDGGTIVALWPDAEAGALESALGEAGAAALYRPVDAPGVGLELFELD